MTISEIIDVLDFLAGCYPATNDKKLQATAQAWVRVFDRKELFPVERVMEAAKRHVMGQNGHVFPTPRDIIENLPPFEDKAPDSSVIRELKD